MSIYISKGKDMPAVVLTVENVPLEVSGVKDGVEARLSCMATGTDESGRMRDFPDRRKCRAIASAENETVGLIIEGLGCQLTFDFDELRGFLQAAEIVHKEANR